MRTLLIDGEGLAYPATFANNPAVSAVGRVRKLMGELSACRAIVAFGSERGDCFRRKLWPAYKEGRGDPPDGMQAAIDGLSAEFMVRRLPGVEADDVLGILATHPGIEGERVIVANDKDMLTVPGLHHNFVKDPPRCVRHVPPEEADRRHMLQTLMGDDTDGYPGCPGIGPVKAEKILWGEPAGWWPRVALAFKAAKLTEADALVQARLARILRADDYDLSARTVLPWTPAGRKVVLHG